MLALVCSAGGAPLMAQPVSKNIALPDVSQAVELRVAYADNPRFAPLADDQIEAVLAQSIAAVRQHFGIALSYSPVKRVPIAALFSGIPARAADTAEKTRIDPTDDTLTQIRLARDLLKSMRADGDIRAQKRFALPHLLTPSNASGDMAFARALVATQHQLLKTWRDAPALDGKPALGPDRYNEYSYWIALGASDMPLEVIITNQPIASAELGDNSVHSALRGGVSNGITSENRSGRFQMYSVLSSFPFLDPSGQALRLRGGGQSSIDEANRQMGLLLAHEIGHQLLHLGHPFNNPHCVMTPPVRLEFAKWAQGLAADKCPLKSSKANTPGAIKFALPEILFK